MPYKDKEKRNRLQRERYAADPEYRLTLARRNAENLAKNPRTYTEEQRERTRKQAALWNANNPGLVQQRVAAWQKANPERTRQLRRKSEATRRARKLGQFVEVVDSDVGLRAHDRICGNCNEKIEGQFHVDHIVPLSKGGLHSYANVQPAHPLCNIRKGSRV